jgi:iron only hydrogenase large subunit-like protein
MTTDIELILKKYKPGRREYLIPLLQEIQDEQGYLNIWTCHLLRPVQVRPIRKSAILRKIGFDKIFTTGTGTGICIKELSDQLLERIKNKVETPLFIPACPAWVKYTEQFMPSLIPQLSTVKSPQQIAGVLMAPMLWLTDTKSW